MNTLPDLAVTGSTGALGAMVARQLAEGGTAQRLLVRDAGRAPELPGAVPLVFSYANTPQTGEALAGVKTLLVRIRLAQVLRVGPGPCATISRKVVGPWCDSSPSRLWKADIGERRRL